MSSVESIKRLVSERPGITNKEIAEHYSVCEETARNWMGCKLKDKLGLFIQKTNRHKTYYTMAYAAKHNVPKKVINSRVNSDQVIRIKEQEYADYLGKINGMWVVPKHSI